MHSAAVKLDRLTKRYNRLTAVDAVSLDIAPGSMVALLGPSGCGKTTCLRMIAGLIQPSAGEILVNGQRITRVPVHKRSIGMLFQNYALFPHLTVAENIAFGLEMRGIGKAEAARKVAEALALVQLGAFGERFPSQLSGGQQQRVALARAIVIEPSVLLLDEPLGALDKGLREAMQVELRALQKRLRLTTVMVTHDQDEALTMADTVVVMRDGHLEQVGPPSEIYQRPTTAFVANFIGASNMVQGQVEVRDGRTAVVATPMGLRIEVADLPVDARDVTVSIRPEAIRVTRRDATPDGAINSVVGRVDQVVYRGFVSHYYLTTAGGQQIIAFEQNRSPDATLQHAVGDEVLAQWTTSSNHVIAQA